MCGACTVSSLPDMTTDQFLEAAEEVMDRMPGATLVKNQVGNLTIMDLHGDMAGWVNLRNGEVNWDEEDESS